MNPELTVVGFVLELVACAWIASGFVAAGGVAGFAGACRDAMVAHGSIAVVAHARTFGPWDFLPAGANGAPDMARIR
mgnify:CR=1 FL=1